MGSENKNRMKTNEKTLIRILALAAVLTIGVVLISGCVEEKPVSCSMTNTTKCNISCYMDFGCKGTCCGCVNKNETCEFEQGISCKIPSCKCVNGKCGPAPNTINDSNSTTNGMDKIEDAIKKKLDK